MWLGFLLLLLCLFGSGCLCAHDQDDTVPDVILSSSYPWHSMKSPPPRKLNIRHYHLHQKVLLRSVQHPYRDPPFRWYHPSFLAMETPQAHGQ